MEIPVSLPLDDDGFLRRACPQCAREFKWHDGPVEGSPPDHEPGAEYFCPYCGQGSAPDQWFTEDQVEYMREIVAAKVLPNVRDELRSAVEPLNRGGLVSVDIEGGAVDEPASLTEPNDMLMVASPCHPYEPVKIAEEWNDVVHCLVCGAPYRLPGDPHAAQ